MSVNSGLFAGVAAVASQSTAFAVISDNIANSNTVGYKETDAQFRTLVTRAPTATGFTAGGVQPRPVSNPQQQGLLQGTQSNTDIAVDGNGFFVVNEAQTPTASDEYFLTRAGSFRTDEDGRLFNTAGYYLQGWLTDANGNIVNNTTRDLLTSLETVNLSQFGSVANETDNATINVNLPSNRTAGQSNTTNITVFDSQGNDYLMATTFTKSAAANTWTYTYTLTDVGTGTAITTSAARTMAFNADGSINTLNGTTGTSNTAATDTITFTAAQITAGIATRVVDDLDIVVNFGTYDQTSGTSQFDDAFAASLLNQDGSGPSPLTAVNISDDGLVSAQFANGQSRTIYRVPIATVPAPTQLDAVTGNAYRITGTSGDIVLNIPQQGGSGRIQSAALENSTVDIAEEFTDLIITQRAYSAATRIITTGDELLDEIIRVKR